MADMANRPANERAFLAKAGSRQETSRKSARWRRRARRSGKLAALCCLALVAVLLGDMLLGLGYRTRTDSQMLVTPPASGTARQALVVFPGYAMDGELLSRAFTPYLGPDDTMVVVRYAERGVDMNDLYRRLVGELKKLKPETLRVYGASMGGMCAVEFLARYGEEAAPVGRAVLVLDTAPSGPATVKRPGWLLGLSSWYRGGPISSAAWALLSQLQAIDPTPEPHADRKLIAEAKNRFAWVGMPALTSQATFIEGFQMPGKSGLRSATSRVVYIHARNAGRDPLVRVDESIEDWRDVFPGVRVVALPGRDGRWHIPLVERPQETLDIALAA